MGIGRPRRVAYLFVFSLGCRFGWAEGHFSSNAGLTAGNGGMKQADAPSLRGMKRIVFNDVDKAFVGGNPVGINFTFRLPSV